MDFVNLKTFLELAATGNFSRVAEHLHVTQSTVRARMKVLEDHLNCELFERTSSGVNLTLSGRRFHHYAVSMQQLWQQGQQEVGLPEGFDGAFGLGIHMALWPRFLPHLSNASINTGLGEIALRYLLNNPGCAYLPKADVQHYLAQGRLHCVKDAAGLNRSSYLVYARHCEESKRLQTAIDGLRSVMAGVNPL